MFRKEIAKIWAKNVPGIPFKKIPSLCLLFETEF